MSIEKPIKDQSKLPEVFAMKIKIDKIIKDLRALPVITFGIFKRAKREQNLIREGCENFIKRQRGP